jgi:hypothetical protein
MIPKGGDRFSDEIMRKQSAARILNGSLTTIP